VSNTEYDSALEKLGIPQEDKPAYTQLLRHLHTPSDLKYLHAVLRNLITTFSEGWLEDISIDNEIVSFTHKSLEQANLLTEALRASSRASYFIRPSDEKNLRKILHGELEANPFYAIYFLLNKVNADFFKWLRQVLFVIPQIIKDRTVDEERLKPYEPVFLGRFFRQMTEREEAIEWLSQTDCKQCKNLKAFVGWLYEYRYFFRRKHNLSFSDLKAEGIKSTENVKESAVARYHEISKCIGILEIPLGHRKNRRTTVTRGPSNTAPRDLIPLHGVTALESDVIVQIETLPDDDDKDNELYSVLQVQLEDELIQAGEEIYEQQQDEMYIFADQEPVESYVAAFHGRRLSKAIMRRIERQHQYLASTRQCLPNTQVYQLLNWVQTARQNFEKAEAASAASIIFFTARPPSKTASINLSDFCLDTQTFKIPAFNVQYATPLPASTNADSTTKPALVLPMASIFHKAFFDYKSYEVPHSSLHGKDNFCSHYKSGKELSDLLENLGITTQQTANHLFIRACAMFGPACATLMFNRPAPGSQARLYYTSISATLLEQRYRQLVAQVLKDAGIETDVFPQKPTTKQEYKLGCREAPTLSDYSNLIEGLHNDLATLSKNQPDGNWVCFHNKFTAYCIVTQGLLTGIRPTHSGFINHSEMLLEARVAVVRDKDSADEYHTRTIPLHPLAIKIAEAYKAHMIAIIGRLHRVGLLAQWKAAGSPEPFFFTNTVENNNGYKVAIMPFRPSLLSQELIEHFSLPPNSNRKLLRSELERKAVPTTCIDALLGHANLGETIWHPHSTLSLAEVQQTVLPHLNKLIEQLNIRAIQGLEA
jgi:hypothetical protein